MQDLQQMHVCLYGVGSCNRCKCVPLCAQENEAVQEEKKKQLYEEGIDAILARAEVNTLPLFAIRPAGAE